MGLTWEEIETSAQDIQTWHQRVALSAMLDELSRQVFVQPSVSHKCSSVI